MKKLLLLALMVLVGCSEDTIGSTPQCDAGETYNPISGLCETSRVVGDNNAPDMHSNVNNANNANNANNTNNDCTDCAVFFRPSNVAFTYTPVRESSSVDVEIVSQVDGAIQVERLEWEGATPNEFVTLGLDPGTSLAEQGSRVVTIQFSPQDTTDDQVVLNVYFQGINEPAQLDVTSMLTGADVCSENCPRVQVSPPAIQFSFQPGDPNPTRTVIVGSVGQSNLEVREVLLIQQGAAFTVAHDTLPLDLRPQTTTNLDITLDTMTPGAPDGRLLIRTNDPFTPEVEVPIRASSKDASTDACINVAPTSLNFGTVQRGQMVMQNFTITNCGPVDLDVTDIRRGSFFGIQTTAAYQLTGWNRGIIAPGASEVVEVTYAPRRAGFDNGSFTVHSNALNDPAVRVNVRGTSEPPPISAQDIHIQVEWDSDNTDVDTHVLLLPGQGLFCDNDCNFSNPEPDWGVQGDWQDDPFLDVDDVDGYGPENVNIETGIDGMNYRVVLHYWDDTHGDSFPDSANVTVRLYHRGNLEQTWGPILLSGTGDTKNVFEIAWPSRTITTFNDAIYSVPSSTSCRPVP